MNRKWWWVLGAAVGGACVGDGERSRSVGAGQPRGPQPGPAARDPVHSEGDATSQAEHAQRVAKQVNGVDEAWVAVVDNTAYVGIELGEGVQQERAERIERTVAEQIVSRVDKIDQAFASTDPAIVGRMREISRDLAGGRPASAYREELERMSARMRARLHD